LTYETDVTVRVTVVILVAWARHAHPPVIDKLVNEEKAPAADVVFVAPRVGIVELEIFELFEEEEEDDVGEESIGSLEFIPFSYEGGGI
jgi:hypothetical protein